MDRPIFGTQNAKPEINLGKAERDFNDTFGTESSLYYNGLILIPPLWQTADFGPWTDPRFQPMDLWSGQA
jgi:hypothetical protein